VEQIEGKRLGWSGRSIRDLSTSFMATLQTQQ